jgi:hypothetical protein
MHGNGCYVELEHEGRAGYRQAVKRAALVASLASALLGPALAQAEIVPGSVGASDAALAVAPGGSPLVAYVVQGSLRVASRSADGTWRSTRLAGLPGRRVVLAGLAAGRNGSDAVLAEDAGGRWLALAERRAGRWRVRKVAAAPRRGLLGFGGLALDRSGHPLVAYAYELASRRTWLRLVHEDRGGRLLGERVTRGGFPPSDVLPSAAPAVLPSGAVRVVAAYGGATIEWSRTQDHRDWVGQLLYGSTLGAPAGIVRAAAGAGGVWSAWTELFPSAGESQLLLTLHGDGERTTVLDHHGFLVSLALAATGPEVAADDYVDLDPAHSVFAGVVYDASGGALELGAALEGYAVDAAGARHYLLDEPSGLAWYRAPAPPAARVVLAAAAAGTAVELAGRVAGATGGSVELWRETSGRSELLATLPLSPDGSFSRADTPPVRPVTYRAVYRDPATGLPLASLLRTPFD